MPGLPIVSVDNPAPNLEPSAHAPRPPWLRVRAPGSGKTADLRRLLEERRLHTVCSSAACPNMGDCWSAGTATFMILGNECTRACRFCDIKTSKTPNPVDLDEPERLAEAAALMGLKHIVITAWAGKNYKMAAAGHSRALLPRVGRVLPRWTPKALLPDSRAKTRPSQ